MFRTSRNRRMITTTTNNKINNTKKHTYKRLKFCEDGSGFYLIGKYEHKDELWFCKPVYQNGESGEVAYWRYWRDGAEENAVTVDTLKEAKKQLANY